MKHKSFKQCLILYLMENIGYKLKKIRELKSYSQEYIADRLNVSPSTISRIENHAKSVRLGLILEYCKVLEVAIEDILSNNESKKTNSLMYSLNINIKDINTFIAIHDALSHIKID